MRKKVSLIFLTWLVIAGIWLIIYFTGEVSPMKEFLAWALSVWPILAVLVTAGVTATALIIKHDFGSKLMPVLFIRSSGFSRLAKDYTQQFQRYLIWYEVTISRYYRHPPLFPLSFLPPLFLR